MLDLNSVKERKQPSRVLLTKRTLQKAQDLASLPRITSSEGNELGNLTGLNTDHAVELFITEIRHSSSLLIPGVPNNNIAQSLSVQLNATLFGHVRDLNIGRFEVGVDSVDLSLDNNIALLKGCRLQDLVDIIDSAQSDNLDL